jgi:transcriptional regulator with XRE-family HTH domain
VIEDRERLKLGLRLRELRRARRLTTRELAARSGVSASLVNQVETGRAAPSVHSLRRIARGLHVPVAEFFLDGDEPADNAPPMQAHSRVAVVRAGHRRRLQLPESHIVYELVTPDLRWAVEVVWIKLDPNHPPVPSMSHPGEECALVIEGTLHVIIGEDEYQLSTGDSITFDSTTPHHIENRGQTPVIEISAITPARF